MEFYREIESSRKLNTKGCCFICLQSEKIVKTEEVEGNPVFQSISIRHLISHLQITLTQSLNSGSSFGQDYKKEDIQVDLCENCAHAISRFSVLFQNLEKIQLEMNYFLERIHKCISQSAKDPDRVQNYSKRMTSDLEALSQLAFVDNLRKQVAKESLKKLNVPRLQLVLTKTKNKLIKTEINEEPWESNDGDFQGNYFPDDISAPPSPNSTANQAEYVERLGIGTSFSASTFTEKAKLSPSLKRSANANKGKYSTKNLSTGMYECKKCDKNSKYRHTIAEHFKSIHLKLRYKCDICNFSVFTNLSTLTNHKKTCYQKLRKQIAKEKDPKFKFICKVCGKRFEAHSKLVDHTRCVHKNLNRFQCDLCDKKYTSKITLRYHQAAIHESKKFYCKICNKMYKYMISLKKHERKCVEQGKIKGEPVDCE